MKYILTILALSVSAFAADSAPASPAILSQTTKNGVTTIITTGRVQTDAAIKADGTVTFMVFPNVTLLDDKELPIAPTQLDTAAGFAVNLSADLVNAVLVEIKAAYAAKQAAAPAP